MVYETELCHYGIKGQKWGVRRYQNPDGTLTAAGKARALKSDYKNAGASRATTNRHAYYAKDGYRRVDKINAAIERLNKNQYGPKQSKQLAKDYSTAINGLNQLGASKKARALLEMDYSDSVNSKIRKLSSKKQTERIRKKIEKLTTDSELMSLTINDLADSHTLNQYKTITKKLVDKLGADSRVVYRTNERALASSGGDIGYLVYGTNYVIKTSTKAKTKSKRYSDPKNKREYDESISKYATYYY